jgi:aspartyl-tRNA(Asn)/glutamyl-tRNA(Gln) amidotransferase subunit A
VSYTYNPFASIAELNRALKRKEISSTELTQMTIQRLKTLGGEHNAIAQMTEELALEQAARADSRMDESRSILNGIPFGVKDLLATRGIPTRWGSPGHADQMFNYDATPVARLQDAGAVLIAKLAMIELAGGGNYDIAGASATGPCASAWDKKLWAGGSSSGSGAATALGAVAFSLGSETAGSIVCPSAFNGATGFRPTYGRVSRYGAMALAWSLDRIGPICRSAEDAGIILETIAGYDPMDQSTFREKLNLRPRKQGPKPVIGLLKEDFAKNKAEASQKAYEESLRVFHSLGYKTVDVAYPDWPYNAAVDIIVNAEGASAHEHFIRSERLNMLADPHQIAGFAAALQTSAVDYLWAMRFRTECLKTNEIWDKCDCIFTPTFYHKAVPIDVPFDHTFDDMGGDNGPSNLLGWPAMAFPIGFEDGAPLSGTVLAPCYREDTCYRVAVVYQKATDWHLRKPVP